MTDLVGQCLKSIVQDDVDEVFFAFGRAHVWLMNNKFSSENLKSLSDRFLDKISQALKRQGINRQHFLEEKNVIRSYRLHDDISNEIIEKFLKKLSGGEGLDFLGTPARGNGE